VSAALEELRDLARRDAQDPFTFVVGEPAAMVGGVDGIKVKVKVYLGATELDSFPIDLSTKLEFVTEVERQRPQPVVEVPDVGPLPEFTLYPLPDQVADKVCAMFQRYGTVQAASSRYRDLVDLVLITNSFELDAALTATALNNEAGRRVMDLPTRLHAPGQSWADGYRKLTRDTVLAPVLHDLDAALAAAGECLDPILSGSVCEGTWDPHERRWTP
jgi:hypothetical protein